MTKTSETKVIYPKGGVRKHAVLDVALTLASDRWEDTVVYNASKRSPIVEYVIVTSAGSDKRATGLSFSAQEVLEKEKFPINHVEGKKGSSWILVDAGSVVVHIFTKEERKNVNIDELYQGCLKTSISDRDVANWVKANIKDTEN